MARDYYAQPCEDPVGDWEFYKWRMQGMRDMIPEGCSTLQESMRQAGVYWLKDYFGDKPRTMSKEPTVLTQAVREDLAGENYARRLKRYPHFVKIASMLATIKELEDRYESNK